MQKVQLTIGHKVGSVEVFDTPAICHEVTTTLGVDAFTAIPCVGMWKGQAEMSTRVEMVFSDDSQAEYVLSLVPTLAHNLNQEAIMVEHYDAAVTFPSAIVPAVA